MSSRSKHRLIFAIIIAVLIVLVCFVVWYPAGEKEAPPAGYTPLRDDDLAARYRPVFDCPTEFGPILAVYYRAARDDSGLIHIAYHPLWAGERNDTKAFWPFLSRILYTGGLSLQRLMYGPGDIETIGLAIDPASGKIVEVDYETAADYDPSRFGVKHQEVTLKGSFDPPLHFQVISWNHLFRLEEDRATELGNGALSVEPASNKVHLPNVPLARPRLPTPSPQKSLLLVSPSPVLLRRSLWGKRLFPILRLNCGQNMPYGRIPRLFCARIGPIFPGSGG